MPENRGGGQGTQKSGQRPNQEKEQDIRKQDQQQRDQRGQIRQEPREQDHPVGGKHKR